MQKLATYLNTYIATRSVSEEPVCLSAEQRNCSVVIMSHFEAPAFECFKTQHRYRLR
jgi:hypothetical protein